MVNKVTLIGRLGQDPEIRHLENGAVVARFSLATNEYYKDKEGNPQETTEWHNVVIWREQAERAEKTLKKGMLCYVEGKISYRKYTGQDGVERNITDIVANYFRALERREGGTDNRFPTGEPQAFASRTQSGTSTTTPDTEPVSANGEGSDGLPF
jgi:single-strand DNA-binding protein